MKRFTAFALNPDVIHTRIVFQRDFGHSVGEMGFFLPTRLVQHDVILDHRHYATRLGNHQATGSAYNLFLRRNEQQMHRRCKRHVARHHNHCRIMQEGSVKRSEYVVTECCVTAEMRFDRCGVRGKYRRQVGHHHAAVGSRTRQLRRIDTINKHQSGACFFNIKMSDIGGFQIGCAECRRKRQFGKLRNIGKAPLLVAHSGHR
jgi:hypothetical protein